MPDYRLTPKRESYSDKLTSLDHLTYRVWQQYKASADDYGVMPDSAATIRGDNRRLEREPERAIRACLDEMIRIGLVHRFMDQGQGYLYSRVWQTHQKVRYPSETFYPAPPSEELLQCDKKTSALFAQRFAKSSEIDLDSSDESSVPPVCAPARNANANANANADGKEGESEREPKAAVHRFFHRWAERFEEKAGQRPEFDRGKDARTAKDLIDRHGIEEVLANVDEMFRSRDSWIRQSGYTVGAFKACFNKLTLARQAAPRNGFAAGESWRDLCVARGHHPMCQSPTKCELLHVQQAGAA